MSNHPTARFYVGQIVHHRLFYYRGVVFDVDATFQGTEEWYEQVARSRPPREEPWYHVLPNGSVHTTYVAEQNLEEYEAGGSIAHPAIDEIFDGLDGGEYRPRRSLN